MYMRENMDKSSYVQNEDELDLELYREAKTEFEADSTTYSLDEVKKEIGLE